MASTFTDLGLELMATGENAGTWGTKTNANLSLIEQLTGGVLSLSIAGGAGNQDLTIADGALTGTAQQRVLEFTGTISGARVIRFPLLTETFYIIKNGTSGAHTVQLKAVSGSGATVTFATGDKGYKLIYLDGVATNTGVFEAALGEANEVTLTGTETLTNKTLTNPIITNIVSTSNGDIKLAPNGTGDVVLAADTVTVGDAAAAAVLRSSGAGTLTVTTGGASDLVLNTNSGTNSGTITITDGAAGAINIAPNGAGVAQVGGSAIKVAGLETMWVPASAMYGSTTNPADAAQIETTANRPDLKTFDFDPDTQQHTQFSVAFPKSWNEGTVTYQVYWSPSTTNTGNCFFGMNGVSVGDGDTIDVAFGNQQTLVDAAIGTVEDQQVSVESPAITIAGSPAVNQQTYFQFFRVATSGTDTFTGDARVLGVKIFFTTDAANDA